MSGRELINIFGSRIDSVTWDSALSKIIEWAQKGASRFICICNAHSVVTAKTSPDFMTVLNSSDMATPDGASVAWLMRILGKKKQDRINGPDLMWRILSTLNEKGSAASEFGVFLYGNTEKTNSLLISSIANNFPNIVISGCISPPFRALSIEEDSAIVEAINTSNAKLIFVSLGCPKQERWMYEHQRSIRGVMLGVGAAFDYHAGVIRRAPVWMRKAGMEWFHRLCSEPRRLWKRYLLTNTLFIYFAIYQLLFG